MNWKDELTSRDMQPVTVPLWVLQELYDNSVERIADRDYLRGYDRWNTEFEMSDEAHRIASAALDSFS